jgi:hypothetical protein
VYGIRSIAAGLPEIRTAGADKELPWEALGALPPDSRKNRRE